MSFCLLTVNCRMRRVMWLMRTLSTSLMCTLRSFLMFTLMCISTVIPHEPCLAPFSGCLGSVPSQVRK